MWPTQPLPHPHLIPVLRNNLPACLSRFLGPLALGTQTVRCFWAHLYPPWFLQYVQPDSARHMEQNPRASFLGQQQLQLIPHQVDQSNTNFYYHGNCYWSHDC